jgi:hypothetical protein
MGYTMDTHFSRFIAPAHFIFTAGTWTPSLASNVVIHTRTATAAAFTAFIPITLPQNASGLKGARLKSIDVWYKIATADTTDFATVELEKMALTADAVAPTGAAVSGITLDSAHDTAAKRKAQASHKMTVTLTTPVWVADTDVYYLELVVDCATSSVVTLIGARANYDLRQ